MGVAIGFVLLTHDRPGQAVRLVNRLNSMFEHPPIAWHHNFTLCDLPTEAITKNVSLVIPHVNTDWGRFSVNDAMMRALTLLFNAKSSPD